MRSATLAVILLGALTASGCHKKESETDAIRAGIMKHLSSLNTLNLSGMDMNVTNVNIQGNQATAQVEFRPKSGAPAGASMQVSYALTKQGADWVVVKNEGVGGAINHPAPGANPHLQNNPAGATGNMPNFQDLLQPGKASTGGSLPPGHPPIGSGSTSGSSSASGSANPSPKPKKP